MIWFDIFIKDYSSSKNNKGESLLWNYFSLITYIELIEEKNKIFPW